MKLFQKNKFVCINNKTWLVLLLCGLNLLLMHYYLAYTDCLELDLGQTLYKDFTMYVDNLMGSVIDVFVLFLILYVFFYKRPKIALIITFIVTFLWSFSNVLYSRFFHHYISLSAVGQSGILFDRQIIRCVFEGLEWFDSYYIISLCLFFILIYKYECDASKSILKLIMFLLLIIGIDFFSYVLLCAMKPEYRYLGYIWERFENRQFSVFLHLCDSNHSTFRRGCLRSVVYELLLDIKGPIHLNEEQLSIIERETDKAQKSMRYNPIVMDNTNLIFILVESYMSFVSDKKIDGEEVTPFLNSLKRDTTVYYNDKMHENVTIGESSDGQFIYMTGLLPLRSVITVSLAKRVTLPGLPKILNRKSRMIIPTVASMWLQDEMCRQYGFGDLYTSNDCDGKHGGVLNDEQVFQLAMKEDKTSIQPFFSIILTMSMHQPFTQQIDSTFLITNKTVPTDLKCYLNACHYTDKQIRHYFEHLKKNGLYENSLIVITADHPVHNYELGGASKDIPLYLINTGVKSKKIYHGECNQIDVYTTLLDLLGCKSEWCGLGHSLLSPTYKNDITPQKWDVSEWIIRSNYFD